MTQETTAQENSPDLAVMTRAQVEEELINFPGAVRLDFSREFVSNQSLEQLKHILAAARMHISIKSNEKSLPPALAPAN